MRIAFAALAAIAVVLTGCSQQKSEVSPVESQRQRGVTVIYYGQACFTIKGSSGFTIVIDPFDKSMGYPMPNWVADVALATHKHFDHANVDAVHAKYPPHVEQFGEFLVGPIQFLGVKVPHFSSPKEQQRGDVAAYRWEQDGVNICHLGDLAQVLTPEQVKALSPVDLLFIPVGGNYTIGPKEAVEVIRQLDPQVVIPMHYRTTYTPKSLDLATIGDFLKACPKDWDVEREAGNFHFFGPEMFNKLTSRPTIWIINP